MGQFIFSISEAKIITRYFHTFSDGTFTISKYLALNLMTLVRVETKFDVTFLSLLNIGRNSIMIFEVFCMTVYMV